MKSSFKKVTTLETEYKRKHVVKALNPIDLESETKKPMLKVYVDENMVYHCDVSLPTYTYGAIRHTEDDIMEYANRHLQINKSKGIDLLFDNKIAQNVQ